MIQLFPQLVENTFCHLSLTVKYPFASGIGFVSEVEFAIQRSNLCYNFLTQTRKILLSQFTHYIQTSLRKAILPPDFWTLFYLMGESPTSIWSNFQRGVITLWAVPDRHSSPGVQSNSSMTAHSSGFEPSKSPAELVNGSSLARITADGAANGSHSLAKTRGISEDRIDLLFLNLDDADPVILYNAINRGVLLKNSDSNYPW